MPIQCLKCGLVEVRDSVTMFKMSTWTFCYSAVKLNQLLVIKIFSFYGVRLQTLKALSFILDYFGNCRQTAIVHSTMGEILKHRIIKLWKVPSEIRNTITKEIIL